VESRRQQIMKVVDTICDKPWNGDLTEKFRTLTILAWRGGCDRVRDKSKTDHLRHSWDFVCDDARGKSATKSIMDWCWYKSWKSTDCHDLCPRRSPKPQNTGN